MWKCVRLFLIFLKTAATGATGEGIETLQEGPARDKSDSYYARLLWLLKVLIESSTTAGQDLNALNNESLQFVNNYILEFVNFMQRTPSIINTNDDLNAMK